VNKYKLLNNNKDKHLQVSIPTTWDFLNRGDLIDQYETIVAEEMVGKPQNFEMARFSRKRLSTSNGYITSVTHKFFFADYTQNTTTPLNLPSTWQNSYIGGNEFTSDELYKNVKSVQKSFFKIDLYDTKDAKKQKNYLTIILNTTQGLPDQIVITDSVTTYECKKYQILSKNIRAIRFKNCCGTTESKEYEPGNIDPNTGWFLATFCLQNGEDILVTSNANVVYEIDTTTGTNYFEDTLQEYTLTYIEDCACLNPDGTVSNVNTTALSTVIESVSPIFILDHIGLKESYFIYWFKDFNILKLDKLYMRVKFFNGKTGEFTTFTTKKQTEINVNNPFRVNNDYFYREVTFDFVNYLYDITNSGTSGSDGSNGSSGVSVQSLPVLEWYEYINPPQNNS
jgi:hypothetical protein